MFISYAQNFEDVILWRALKHVENGFYIDIGAQDPVIDSVSRGFYEKGWRGVHVEPTATYAGKLRENRPDEDVLQVAIGKGGHNIRFFEIPDTGLSTGDPEIAETHREKGFEVLETEVPLQSLDTLFDRIGDREIHWLKIDVEGMEKSVIESWEASKLRPWVVVVESTRPLRQDVVFQDWEPLILDKGYKFIYFDGLNRFYISQEHTDLEKAFGVGPNIFDEFSVSGDASSLFAAILNERIRVREENSRNLKLQLKELDENNKDIARRLKLSEEKIVELNKKNNSLTLENHTLTLEIDAVSSKMQAELTAIHSSISWRITAPLRRMNYLLRWFMHGCVAWLTLKSGSRPRRMISRVISAVFRYVSTRPALTRNAKRIIKYFPSTEQRLRRLALASQLSRSANIAKTSELGAEPEEVREVYHRLKQAHQSIAQQ